MNGDTLDGVNGSFWQEGLMHNYPIVSEPEVMYFNYGNLSTNTMSWGYWTSPILNPRTPLVSTYKAMTNGRHMTHLCERFETHRTDALQYAFFNGVGYETWENVWGVYNQITPRDSAAIKRTSPILRRFGELVQGGGVWTPHVPVVTSMASRTFASEFRNE